MSINFYLYYIGAVDTKSTLIEILLSVEILLEAGFGLELTKNRPIILAFGHDEEISGPQVR